MPESRGRTKKRGGGRYQLEPSRRKKAAPPRRWYAPLVLGVMVVGVIVIVWNYLSGNTQNLYLWVGLGLIALGFLGTTNIR